MKTSPDIVIAEFMDEAAVESLAADFAVHYDRDLADHPDALRALLPKARALIIRNRTEARGAILEAAVNLKVIGRLGVGLDNIDLETCRARGIAVRPAIGANAAAVAEYVIAAALHLLRRTFGESLTQSVMAGEWSREHAMQGREIGGKCMGLIGYGGIAREVARRAHALGMEVIAHDPHLESTPAGDATRLVDFSTLLADADIISLHVPLTDDTGGLLDARAIAAMKKDAVLINTARGGIVDEAALCTALREGNLAGAALDVFANEPLDAAGGAAFRDVPNLLLTPHIAGLTPESNERVSAMVAAHIREVLEAG